MKVDKDIMSGLEEYLNIHLKQIASNRVPHDSRDYSVGVANQLVQLMTNLSKLQTQEVQLSVMENMKDVDLSTIDFNKMLEKLMRGDV
jgi:hypothetical protein|nr:MAG TPA: hypothetical protein [Inoviridae sp.]